MSAGPGAASGRSLSSRDSACLADGGGNDRSGTPSPRHRVFSSGRLIGQTHFVVRCDLLIRCLPALSDASESQSPARPGLALAPSGAGVIKPYPSRPSHHSRWGLAFRALVRPAGFGASPSPYMSLACTGGLRPCSRRRPSDPACHSVLRAGAAACRPRQVLASAGRPRSTGRTGIRSGWPSALGAASRLRRPAARKYQSRWLEGPAGDH